MSVYTCRLECPTAESITNNKFRQDGLCKIWVLHLAESAETRKYI